MQRVVSGKGFRGELWPTKVPSSWGNGCLSSEVPGPPWDPGGVGHELSAGNKTLGDKIGRDSCVAKKQWTTESDTFLFSLILLFFNILDKCDTFKTIANTSSSPCVGQCRIRMSGHDLILFSSEAMSFH